MKNPRERIGASALGAALLTLAVVAAAGETEPGFKSLFNGKDLTGWAGRPQHWSVQDGAITGITTKETPAQGNNFLIAKEGEQDLVVSDFELRFSYCFTGPSGNSGLQYRSQHKGNFVVHGYQADFEVGPTFSGILYEEGGRGILAQRGQKVVIREAEGKTKIDVVGTVGVSQEIQASIKTSGWNDYVVIAQGNHLQHFINGKQTVDVVDEQASKAAKSGILAFQIHVGPPMKIQFKNVRIKPLGGLSAAGGDLEQMQGEWTPAEVVFNGQNAPADMLANFKLKIKGNEYFLETAEGQDQGRFQLKEGNQPKTMDVTTNSGDEVPAIYELSADALKVCYAINSAARPTQFASAEGSNHVLTVYKRKPR
jgi:uncharacterized protein (TIGR03067 family)